MRYFSQLNHLKAGIALVLSCLVMASQAGYAETHKSSGKKTQASSSSPSLKKGPKSENSAKSVKQSKNNKNTKLAKQGKNSKTKHSPTMAATAHSLASSSVRSPSIPAGKELSPKLPPLAAGSQRVLGQGIGAEPQKSNEDINPIKANGIWVGSIDGKQAYRLGEALYMDPTPSNIYTKPVRSGIYPQLPPMPIIEGSAQ